MTTTLLLLRLRLMLLMPRRAFPHHSRRLTKQQAGDAPLSEVATSESQTVGEAVQPQPQPQQQLQTQAQQARQAQQKTPAAQMAKCQRTDLLVQQCCRQMAPWMSRGEALQRLQGQQLELRPPPHL